MSATQFSRTPTLEVTDTLALPTSPETAHRSSMSSATSDMLSPTATYVDVRAAAAMDKKSLKSDSLKSNTGIPTDPPLRPTEASESIAEAQPERDPLKPKLKQSTKWSLLALFSLAFFIDIWLYSAFFIFTGTISHDLDIVFEQQAWVITSYSVTFAAFLLFWGRVSDLYSAKPVFSYGFVALGIINLVISFLPDKYSFFVLRALAGIAGSALIPSAFRLIVHVFEPEELSKAFTIYGFAGTISNVTGTIIAGFIGFINNGGQMQSWRWFFRISTIIILPAALISLYAIPEQKGEHAELDEPKWKRLDIMGSFLMLSAIVLLILGLTLGASYGWKKPGFLVPFLLSWVLFPAFFLWESYLGDERALLPPKTWRIPNFTVFIVFALQIYAWWSTNFVPLVEVFVRVYGEKPIIAAVRTLPQGVAAFAMTILLTAVPVLVSRPRWPITFGMIGGMVGYVLMTRGNYVGADYWRFLFPGFVIGSGAMMAAFTGTNVGVMTSVPPEMAGVAGATLQVALQVGAAVGLAVQAGLLTASPGGIANRDNVNYSFYFQLGWAGLWLIGFLVFYRPSKNAVASDADGAEKARPIIMH